jgi:hypothetical protein
LTRIRLRTLATVARASSVILLPELHQGQIDAHWALQRHRFRALRCGRRFGKTEFAKAWIAQGLIEGQECAWLAPQRMMWSEVFSDLMRLLGPIVMVGSRSDGVIRFSTGGRLDFYSLENPIVGRGKRYHRMVIDEAAFAKNGDNRLDDSMIAIWEKALKPTLIDFAGEVLVCSNSAGKNPDNFFFNICTDPQYGFKEFHATTLDNPLLPKRLLNESIKDWATRRAKFLDDLKRDNDPLSTPRNTKPNSSTGREPRSLAERSCWRTIYPWPCRDGANMCSRSLTRPRRPGPTTTRPRLRFSRLIV